MTIAPMSLYTANSLKEKLLRGIDPEGNIIDMGVVRDVLKILDNFELSKDDLEGTRIGLYVNRMRKRTSDHAIAKQSKCLIRKWQAVVEQAVTTTSVVSGTQSNPGVPFSHVSNHRRKLEDCESIVNSNCDSNSPVSSLLGNGQTNANMVATATLQSGTPTMAIAAGPPKSGLSLRIKLGKPSAWPSDANESSLSPALPSVKNGLQSGVTFSNDQPDKPHRRIKSTAELAMELQRKNQLNLSSEFKEKLEKQRTEMPLQTLNEPIPAPFPSGAHLYGNDRKHRGKKRGSSTPIDYVNSPSPGNILLMSAAPDSVKIDSDDSRLPSGGVKLLSAEKSEMVKRFLDTSVPPAEMPLTPASVHQSPTPPEMESELFTDKASEPPVENKCAFPEDYTRLSTDELYSLLSASFSKHPVSAEKDPVEKLEANADISFNDIYTDVDCRQNSRLPGITGIVARSQTSEEKDISTMETDGADGNQDSSWTKWEECVTLVSNDPDKRPVFILPFVDIPEGDLPADNEDTANLTVPQSELVTSSQTLNS